MKSKRWVPESALLDGVVEKSVHTLLSKWASVWFQNTPDMTVLLSFALNNRETSKSSLFWRTPSGKISFLVSDDGRRALVEQMLGVLPARKKMNDEDEALIAHLVVSAIEDLRSGLFGQFDCRETFQEGDPRRGFEELPSNAECVFSVLLSEKVPLLHIFVDREMVVNARLKLAQRLAGEIAIEPLDGGLDDQNILVGARLGSVDLEIKDFRNLESGDTVILDRELTNALPITIDGREIGALTCEIIQSDAGAKLRITEI